MDLFFTFKKLPTPTKGNLQSFSAVQIDDTAHRIGKDISGWPVLLINTTSGQNSPQIHLEHLEVQHLVRCRITIDKKNEEGIFTVVRCMDADNELIRYFFNFIDPILKTLGPNPTLDSISRAINHLVELFRVLTQPPTKSVAGLWAELFVIRDAKDPISLLNAWHANPEEKYDFNDNAQRVEVKSTSKRDRIHHFSLEQLTPPAGSKVIIASLYVEGSGGGLSINDLVQEIKNLISEKPELIEKLDNVVFRTLGNALSQSMNCRFDRQLAQESLRIFEANSIPKISEPIPSEISDVHFRVDLSRCRPLSKQELTDAGGIFSGF